MNPPRPRSPRKPGEGVLFANFSRNAAFNSPTGASDLRTAQQEAADWINQHPNLDLITIESCLTETTAIVTVWYRLKRPSAPI